MYNRSNSNIRKNNLYNSDMSKRYVEKRPIYDEGQMEVDGSSVSIPSAVNNKKMFYQPDIVKPLNSRNLYAKND